MSPRTIIEAMIDAGVAPGAEPVVADGKIHRYRGPGDKRGQKNCWYVLFEHGGAFGSYRLGFKQNWSSGANRLSKAQRQKLKADIEEAQAKVKAEQKQIHETAAKKAQRLYNNSKPARADHPYLVRKGIQSHGIRQLGHSLAIPVRDVRTGDLISLQFIQPDGSKTFLSGGRIQGGHFPLGSLTEDPEKQVIAIAEGFATAATIHESVKSFVQCLVLVAFNCGNLFSVAKAVRHAYPNAAILICADDDRKTPGNPGFTKAQEAAKAINGGWVLPEFPNGAIGSDFNDLAALTGTELAREQILSAIAIEQKKWQRPIILVDQGEWPEKITQAEKTLVAHAEDLRIFQRGGEITRILPLYNEDLLKREKLTGIKFTEGQLLLDLIPVIAMVETLERLIDWRVTRHLKFGDTIEPANCPKGMVERYMGRKKWRLPHLTGIIEAPILLSNGEVLTTHGYHRQSGLYLASREAWPVIPDWANRTDAWDAAREATRRLLEPFSEFPFVTPADRAVFLSAILTALQRRRLASAPLIAFSAHAQRTGKSMLAESLGILAIGRRPPATSIGDGDEDEMRKSFIGILRSGAPLVNLDNILPGRPLNSPDLAKILTQTTFQGRILCTNNVPELPTNLLITATGNNFSTKGDLTSRTLVCMQDPNTEHPEKRTFTIDDLPAYLSKHRVELITDALTILKAWHVAGKPDQELERWGGFDEWSREIREPIVWLGLDDLLADPYLTRQDVAAHDPERELDAAVLEYWYLAHPHHLKTVGEIIADIRNNPYDRKDFKQAILNAVTEPREPDEINSRRFGNWCARVVGRWIEGFKLVRGGKVHQAQQWGVEKEIGIELLHSPGISGLNGTNGNGNGISPKPEVPQETCNYFTGAVRSAPCKHCGQSYAAHK